MFKFIFIIIIIFNTSYCLIKVYDNESNLTVERFEDADSIFGSTFQDGSYAYVVKANPLNACSDTIDKPPYNFSRNNVIYVALIIRGNCTFDKKVYAAQISNYGGAIIFNNVNDNLFHMTQSASSPYQINIPSKLIGLSDGQKMIHQNYVVNNFGYRRYIIVLYDNINLNPQMYIIVFMGFISLGFFLIGVGFALKLFRDFIKRRANRLRKCHLKKLPIKKFVKGVDPYEMCAICLEDYEEGDKLRILPCHHAYHSQCIDPWLLRQKRNCPVCKSHIVIPGYRDDDTDNERQNSPAGESQQHPPALQTTTTTATAAAVSSEMNSTNQETAHNSTNGCDADSCTSVDTICTVVMSQHASSGNLSIPSNNEVTPLLNARTSGASSIGAYQSTSIADVRFSGSNNPQLKDAPISSDNDTKKKKSKKKNRRSLKSSLDRSQSGHVETSNGIEGVMAGEGMTEVRSTVDDDVALIGEDSLGTATSLRVHQQHYASINNYAEDIVDLSHKSKHHSVA